MIAKEEKSRPESIKIHSSCQLGNYFPIFWFESVSKKELSVSSKRISKNAKNIQEYVEINTKYSSYFMGLETWNEKEGRDTRTEKS